VLRGRRQVVIALSIRYESFVVSEFPTSGFGVEQIAGGPWQTRVRPVPKVNE
jgi:hypothetical protein